MPLLLFLGLGLDTRNLFLPLLGYIGGIPESGETGNGHEGYPEGGAADEDPAEALDFGFGVAAEHGADFIVDFLDLRGGGREHNVNMQRRLWFWLAKKRRKGEVGYTATQKQGGVGT